MRGATVNGNVLLLLASVSAYLSSSRSSFDGFENTNVLSLVLSFLSYWLVATLCFPCSELSRRLRTLALFGTKNYLGKSQLVLLQLKRQLEADKSSN